MHFHRLPLWSAPSPVLLFPDFPGVGFCGCNVSGHGHFCLQIPRCFWSFQTAFSPVPEAGADFHCLHFLCEAPQIQGRRQAPECHRESAADILPRPPGFHTSRINSAGKIQKYQLRSARSMLCCSAYFPAFPLQIFL